MNYNIEEIEIADNGMLCEPIATYSYNAHRRVRELRLFDNVLPEVNESGTTNGSLLPNAKTQVLYIVVILVLTGIPMKISQPSLPQKYQTATYFVAASLAKTILLLQHCNALME